MFVWGREWRNLTGPSWKNNPQGASGAFVHKCVNRPISIYVWIKQILLRVSLLQAQTADRSGRILKCSRLPCFNGELGLV